MELTLFKIKTNVGKKDSFGGVCISGACFPGILILKCHLNKLEMQCVQLNIKVRASGKKNIYIYKIYWCIIVVELVFKATGLDMIT